MTSSTKRFTLFRASGFGLSVLLALAVFGCGDKALPTQPPQGTPTPVRPTPTPAPPIITFRDPIPGPAVAPPAGYTHAAKLSFTVHQEAGVTATLTGLTVGFFNGVQFVSLFHVVSVSPPLPVSSRPDTGFTAVVASNESACAEEIGVEFAFTDALGRAGVSSTLELGCSQWPGLFE